MIYITSETTEQNIKVIYNKLLMKTNSGFENALNLPFEVFHVLLGRFIKNQYAIYKIYILITESTCIINLIALNKSDFTK